ncbi:MAG: ATP-binding cassette domain-containing protein [Proteobacteria bacterium]|nr:ATP-binding cassette domain-containing protein [Pseudomonadota bacterium]
MSLSRDGVRVLRDIHWRVRPGERWVLVGANGSGKTQLLKTLAGIVRPSSAANPALGYRWMGEWHHVPHEVRELIAYVGPERQDKYQRNGWDMSVRALVGTGIYGTDIPLDALTRADRGRIDTLLERLQILKLARRAFLGLSYGERRLALLARALARKPRLLLLDEAFTGLDSRNHERLQRWLARQRGPLPIVMVTHQLEDVPASATHALVLRRGTVVAAGPVRSVHLNRHLARAAAPHGTRGGIRRRRGPAHPLLALYRGSVYLDDRRALRAIDWEIHKGDFWVVHGENGSGKTTLLRTAYGDHGVAIGGRIRRAGIDAGTPLELFRQRTGFSAPYIHARYPRATSVAEVVLSGRHASIGLHRAPTRGDRAAMARVLKRLGMWRWRRRTLAELSYGQTRLVLFARAIVGDPELVLIDEPFDSIDAGTRETLARELRRLHARGTAVAVTAHQAAEWGTFATHELELADGDARYCGPIRDPAARK